MPRWTAALPLLAPMALAACGEPLLEGFVWDVALEGTEDLCNDPVIGYADQLSYRLVFDGSAVDVAVGPDVFATGTVSGCEINYASVVFGETLDGFELRWRLDGFAVYHQGFGCETRLDDNIDWSGTEVFTVVQSDHPDIPTNCTYSVDIEGTYAGPADGG
jgi:hypothetical protein